MNCRQCRHKQDWDVTHDGEVFWPCARGVASLMEEVVYKTTPLKDGVYEYKKPVARLPWLIQEHDCPEFEEAG